MKYTFNRLYLPPGTLIIALSLALLLSADPVVAQGGGSLPGKRNPLDYPDVPKVKKKIPDFLVEPLEILPGDNVPDGTFVHSVGGYILCRGKAFQGPPPQDEAYARIIWQGRAAGKSSGQWNNEVAGEIEKTAIHERKKLQLALRKFLAGLKADPLFFPFLYNAGRVSFLLNYPRNAISFLKKARDLMPEYYGIYMKLGDAYARLEEEHAAVTNYRLAAKKNPIRTEPLIALGNFYLERQMKVKARYYYRNILKKHPDQPNAKIGLARLMMLRKDYVRANLMLDSIITENLDGTPRGDYDRSMHYYQAIIATELGQYGAAVKHYDRLLKFPEDPFFIANPIIDIHKRRSIVKRLADVTGGQ